MTVQSILPIQCRFKNGAKIEIVSNLFDFAEKHLLYF